MSRKPLPIRELASLPDNMAFEVSWKGDKVAFFSNRTGRIELYVANLHTKEVTQLTNGEAPTGVMAGVVWTRDDRSIIFCKDNKGDEHHNLFQIDVETKQVSQLTDSPLSQEYANEVHPDNQHVTVASTRSGQMNIHLVDLNTKEWVQLTNYRSPASPSSWSPDGNWLAFTTNESENLINSDVYLASKNGSDVKKIFSASDNSHDGVTAWHPSGSKLLVSSDSSGVSRSGILSLTSGEVTWLGKDGVEEHPGRFSNDGEWLFTVQNVDSALRPMLYHTETGEPRPLKLPAGLAQVLAFVDNDSKLVVNLTASNQRAELVLYDLATDTYDVLLPAEYKCIDASVFVEAKHIRYPSADGTMVPAILWLPSDIQPGEKLPSLVYVHGGPTAQWFQAFNPFAQLLVSRGFAVLMPNPRGSTGYGVEWRDACIKDWGGKDLDDVAAGAEYLKGLEYIDGNRIAIHGGSYGGYMTYIAVTKRPDLFQAAMAYVGITDIHQLYEEDMPHFQYYLRQQMGDPVKDAELWRERSAITYADSLKAKLLMVHGLNDPRCPISQARLFRDRLVQLGYQEGTNPDDDYEYHEFDIGHGGGGGMEQRIKDFELMTDFLNRRLISV